MTSEPIAIINAKRTPIGSFNGYYKDTPAPRLAASCITSLLDNTAYTPREIDAVILGCVLPAGIGQAPARQASIFANLPYSTNATTINKMCGSAMQAVIMAHDSLVAGSNQVMIAGGMENMSRAPYLLNKARFGYRLGHDTLFDHMMIDGLEDAYQPNKSMGDFADECAANLNINRSLQDEYAILSIQRAQHAIDHGLFNDEIAPITIQMRGERITIQQDQGPATAKPEKIPHLKPAFSPDGSITAANASSISDGAAALLLSPLSHLQQRNISPLAIIKGHYTHSQAPEHFATAPIEAIKGLCDKINWPLDSVDLFEINEAFAVVTLATLQALKLDISKVNINGGACILGHPIGATGARIITTLLYALKQRQCKRGIATLCIAGGEATAIAIEIN